MPVKHAFSRSPGDSLLLDATTATAHNDVSITCHESPVPAYVEQELIRLYGSLYASLAHFQANGDTATATTYVARKEGAITSIFLFRQSVSDIEVINEMFTLDREEVRRFAHYIFTSRPSVTTISFRAVDASFRDFSYPICRWYHTDDIVVSLPSSEEEYLSRLGKATRKNIKQHLSRLWRNLPNARHEVYELGQASEQQIRSIIELNRRRMIVKNKVSMVDEAEADYMVRLVKLCGLVSVITVDGCIRAGAICCQVGDDYFSIMNAHDPDFDRFRLGTLCCYLLICDCIKRHGKTLHFMWGRYDYKFKLLGVLKGFEKLLIYRSHAHAVMDAARICSNWIESGMLQLKFAFLDEVKKRPFLGKLMSRPAQMAQD